MLQNDEYCELENFTASYVEYSLFLPIIFLLELLLLIRTICHEYRIKKKLSKDSESTTIRSLRILFILLQFIALFFMLNDIFRFAIDAQTLILRDTIFCDVAAYSPKFVTTLYYGVYLYQILLRLRISFQDSFLAISRSTMIILSSLIIIFSVGIPIGLIISIQPSCIWLWKPIYFGKGNGLISFCSSPNVGVVNIVIITAALWVFTANILFGIIFSIKLKKTLSIKKSHGRLDRGHKELNFKLKSLIVKNSILTLVGSISTLFNYICFLIFSSLTGGNGFFAYLDMLINCIIIALMFRYNQKYYKKLCKCCVILCLRDLDQGYDKKNKNARIKRQKTIGKYLERDDLSSILDASTKTLSDTQNSKNRLNTLSSMVVQTDNNTHIQNVENIQLDELAIAVSVNSDIGVIDHDDIVFTPTSIPITTKSIPITPTSIPITPQ